VAGWAYATPLMDLLTDDPRIIELGAVYLRIIMLATTLQNRSVVASMMIRR